MHLRNEQCQRNKLNFGDRELIQLLQLLSEWDCTYIVSRRMTYPDTKEKIIKDNAKGLVDLGFADLGYKYVTPDCGWPTRDRNADGSIAWNATLFPSGFPALGEYIHGLGLLYVYGQWDPKSRLWFLNRFGLYSGAGIWECDVVNGASRLQASLGMVDLC